jgi:hypothetical protein
MSWSVNGSIAFATVSAASRNHELSHWIHFSGIDFTLRKAPA